MDCPGCRGPVLMVKGVLQQSPANMRPAIRSVERATRWATPPIGPYAALEDFLTDPTQQPTSKPFRSGYWPQINV